MTRDVQGAITKFWDSIASGYEAHPGNVPARNSKEFKASISAVRDLLPPAPADILDIATGTGFVALVAASLGHRVTGIDLAATMLAEARKKAARRKLHVAFQKGDAIAPDFPPASFDAVISRHLFWTLRDPQRALKSWKRLLRPGGRIVLIDGFWFAPIKDNESEKGFFERFYSRDLRRRLPGWQYFDTAPIVALFEAQGFRNVSLTSLDAIHRVARNPPSAKPSFALTALL